jgi:hypothetical protein
MIQKVAKMMASIIVLASLAGAASAQPFSASPVPVRRAPAPLLAAGIPALIALGGVGVVGRLVRRRKAAAATRAAGNPDQA